MSYYVPPSVKANKPLLKYVDLNGYAPEHGDSYEDFAWAHDDEEEAWHRENWSDFLDEVAECQASCESRLQHDRERLKLGGHGPTCNCVGCNPQSRGNALPEKLSDEPTVTYTIKMPASLRESCKAAGAARVREILEAHL